MKIAAQTANRVAFGVARRRIDTIMKFSRPIAMASAIVATLVFVQPATATISPAPPASFTMEAPGVTMGTFSECDIALTGQVVESGSAGAGGSAAITGGEGSNCGFGQALTLDHSEPWQLTMTPVAGNSDGSNVTLSGIRWVWTVALLSCSYRGTLNGSGSDSADTITFANVGLVLQPGSSFGCRGNLDVNGTFTFDTDVQVD